MKKIICSAVAGCIILSSFSCLAANVNITINGEEFIPKNALGEVVEPFIDNGSTFLPVRAIGEAVGKEVSFDPVSYSVFVGEKPEESKIKEPYALVGSHVYCIDDLKIFYNLDNMIMCEKICARAERKHTENEINAAYEKYLSDNNLKEENLTTGEKRFAYAEACAKLLVNSTGLKELTEKLNYATIDRVVLLVGENDYVSIDSIKYTAEDLKIFSSVLTGKEDKDAGIYYLKSLLALRNIIRDGSIISEEELLLEIKKLNVSGYNFNAVDEKVKTDRFMKLLATYSLVMKKTETGVLGKDIFDKWDEEEKNIPIECEKKLKVFVDGELIVPCDVNGNYVSPQNNKGTVYVPVRAIVEALGMKADWDNDARCVVIIK